MNLDNSAEMISNCALAIVDVSDDWDIGILNCYSCLPGFKPSYHGSTNKITACTAIPNCNTNNRGNWFNSCSTCVFSFNDSTKEINYDECILDTVAKANCFASVAGNCKVCKKGFDKDSSGNCVSWNSPFCPNHFTQVFKMKQGTDKDFSEPSMKQI